MATKPLQFISFVEYNIWDCLAALVEPLFAFLAEAIGSSPSSGKQHGVVLSESLLASLVAPLIVSAAESIYF